MTPAQALAAATARLRAAGVADPARDARLLLAHALGIAPDRVMLAPTDPLSEAIAKRFEGAVAARAARQPVSQIVGRRAFYGRTFRVTPDVLDPRPETETLVAAALSAPFERVLDLGTGSGAILLTLLAERPDARGLGVDLSPEALAVAQANAEGLGRAGRADFRLSDWFAGVTGFFDLIVANPPYIAADEMPGLAPEVRDWEPHLALSPGADGLSAIRRIAAGAGAHLRPGGRLLIEIGAGQGGATLALLEGSGFDARAILCDLDGRDRVASAIWLAQPGATNSGEMDTGGGFSV
jgi:release factor glutamine methyltransferase